MVASSQDPRGAAGSPASARPFGPRGCGGARSRRARRRRRSGPAPSRGAARRGRAPPPPRHRGAPSRPRASRRDGAAARRARQASRGARRRVRSRPRRPRARPPARAPPPTPRSARRSRARSRARPPRSRARRTLPCARPTRSDRRGSPEAPPPARGPESPRPRRRRRAGPVSPRTRARSASRERERATRRSGAGPSSATPGRARAGRARARDARGARPRSTLVGDERRDDHGAIGLLALAERLEAGAVLEPVVDDLPFRWAHRLKLDLLAGLERPLGGAVGLALDRLATALAVAGGVHEHPLAIPAPAEGGAIAEKLHRVDRLRPAADQKPDVLALDPRQDLLRPLVDLDLGGQVERLDHLLEQGHDALPRLARKRLRAHRLFFRLRGGGGGGLAATASSGVGGVGDGIILCTTTCWPSDQTLVAIQ